MNWKLFFVNSNRGLGMYISRLFLVACLEIWDLLVNFLVNFLDICHYGLCVSRLAYHIPSFLNRNPVRDPSILVCSDFNQYFGPKL